MALSAYRALLRSMSLAFANDGRVLHAARHQARAAFQQHASLDPAGTDAAEHLAHAADVTAVLRRNVVQAEQVNEGDQHYRLRLHEHTERGDNSSVKMPKAAAAPADTKPNALAGRGRNIPRPDDGVKGSPS